MTFGGGFSDGSDLIVAFVSSCLADRFGESVCLLLISGFFPSPYLGWTALGIFGPGFCSAADSSGRAASPSTVNEDNQRTQWESLISFTSNQAITFMESTLPFSFSDSVMDESTRSVLGGVEVGLVCINSLSWGKTLKAETCFRAA